MVLYSGADELTCSAARQSPRPGILTSREYGAAAYGARQLVAIGDNELLAGLRCTQSSDTDSRWVRVTV